MEWGGPGEGEGSMREPGVGVFLFQHKRIIGTRRRRERGRERERDREGHDVKGVWGRRGKRREEEGQVTTHARSGNREIGDHGAISRTTRLVPRSRGKESCRWLQSFA